MSAHGTVWLVEEDSYDSRGPEWIASSFDDALTLVKQYQARTKPDSGLSLLQEDGGSSCRVYLGPEADIRYQMFWIQERDISTPEVEPADAALHSHD